MVEHLQQIKHWQNSKILSLIEYHLSSLTKKDALYGQGWAEMLSFCDDIFWRSHVTNHASKEHSNRKRWNLNKPIENLRIMTFNLRHISHSCMLGFNDYTTLPCFEWSGQVLLLIGYSGVTRKVKSFAFGFFLKFLLIFVWTCWNIDYIMAAFSLQMKI